MRHPRRRSALVLTLLLAATGRPAVAADGASSGWSLEGGFQLGLRSVDLEGRAEKYREDLDLEDGPRLFHLGFDLVPPAGLRDYFDRFELELERIGGDPFESIRLGIEKYGRFALEWQQRRSAYFYDDLILPPELASPELADAGDSHTFDFDRVRDSASLALWLTSAARLEVGFDRFTKRGTSTTTYDVERDEFEVDRPIDESLNEYHLGLSYDWSRATLILREQIREYENSVEAFLPGASTGSATDDPTVLDLLFLSEPYDLTSFGHSAAVVARPSDRLRIRVGAAREELELDVRVSEEARGVDFQGNQFEIDRAGAGELERRLELVDMGASYRLSDRLAIVVEVESRSLDQQGSLLLDVQEEATAYRIDTTGGEVALELEPRPGLTLSAGVRHESREVESDHQDSAEPRETEHRGYFAMVGWRPDRSLSLSARYDDSSFDRPFTSASPADRRSLRLRARYTRPLGLTVSGTYHLDRLDNARSGWRSEVEHLALRAGYRFALLSLSAGYSVVEADRGVDQTVLTLPGFMGGIELFFPIAYRAEVEITDARFSWAVNPRLKLGGDLRSYRNRGSFGLRRQQARLFSELGFGDGYVARLGLRRVDYDEWADDFDDYRAEIIELSLGYRWR